MADRDLVQRWMVIMIVDKPRAKVAREPRRQLNRRATWISVDGTTKSECFVLDVSPGGAKIMTDAEIDVRDTFGLALLPVRAIRHQRQSERVPDIDLGVAATYTA